MEIRPDVLSVGPERQSVQVKSSCLIVQVFEGVGYSDIYPNSYIVRADVQSSMVELYRFVGPSKVGKSSSYFVHKQVIGRVQVESPVEKINGDLVFSFNEEKDSQGSEKLRIV